MKCFVYKSLIVTLSLFSVFTVSAEDSSSSSVWKPYGYAAAAVSSMEDNDKDSDFTQLRVICSATKGKSRHVTIRDIAAKEGDIIEWSTNNEQGKFIQRSSMLVVRVAGSDKSINEHLIKVIKRDEWINFTNLSTGSSARYTLNGAKDVIDSITYCKDKHFM